MGDSVQTLCEQTKDQLQQGAILLEQFLNEHSLKDLVDGQSGDMEPFYREFLSDLRHVLVFSEVLREKLGLTLRRPEFNRDQAEKVLYECYHQCVNLFFYPKHECYSEDGRYAYKGEDSIRFRKKPSREVRTVIMKLWDIFAELRENLSYYEMDYIAKLQMQGQRV